MLEFLLLCFLRFCFDLASLEILRFSSWVLGFCLQFVTNVLYPVSVSYLNLKNEQSVCASVCCSWSVSVVVLAWTVSQGLFLSLKRKCGWKQSFLTSLMTFYLLTQYISQFSVSTVYVMILPVSPDLNLTFMSHISRWF